jgi:hypothetical protein
MEVYKAITEEEFYELELVHNHFVDASWNGNLFETYGEELDYVIKHIDTNQVLTIIEYSDDDESVFYVTTGFHRVNRYGYLILAKPYEYEFEVKID